MVIAIDAMGGDSAPEEIVKGVVQAAQETDGRLALVGNAARLEALLTPEEQALVNIVSAESVVGMDEPPARALRGKRDSSLAVAVDMVPWRCPCCSFSGQQRCLHGDGADVLGAGLWCGPTSHSDTSADASWGADPAGRRGQRGLPP